MNYFLYIFALLMIGNFSIAQDVQKKPEPSDVKALIESKRFEFIAESANPMRGRTIFLSPGYAFTVLPDSIVSNLPYYGRAYSAPMSSRDAGIQFTSTDFDYTLKPRKRNGWDIDIKPKDVAHSPQIQLSVTSSGYGSLRVTSFDRQSISFSGYIRKPAKQ